MITIKKVFFPLLTLGVAAVFFSCNSNSDNTKTDDSKMAADTTAVAPLATPVPAAFTPFDVVEMTHTVKDYGKWRPFFDADSANRQAAGMENIVVARNIANPNNLLIVLKISDMAKAKAFQADPKLKEVMQKAGVISKPEINFWHVIRYNPDSHEKQWVEVTHKVKDFDAWLKVYDGEGTAQRASEGLVDVVMARGISDSNMVHLVFDITDMAKAKAAMTSEAKKKLMMSAGVEGVPTMEFYKSIE